MSRNAQAPKVPTMKELREAIPQRCFQSSTTVSLSYVARDVALMILLAYAASHIPMVDEWMLRGLLWLIYGFVQGLVFVGIWILAHECGHGALFKDSRMNNSFGFVLHSFLLVPYFSWKYSHARHHRYTNHIDKDAAFVPQRENEFQLTSALEKAFDLAEDTPALNAMMLIAHQLFGWPMYLLFAVTSGKSASPHTGDKRSISQSHFDPLSDLWTTSQRFSILLSDLGLAATISGLAMLARRTSNSTAVLLYVLPYLWTNHWLVAITYLHHTHPEVPHFEEDTWTFQKGALSTVDRDFGFIGRHLFHGIIEYHVIHHLFPRIPFYHAQEATENVRSMLGDHYRAEKTSFLGALWETFSSCKYVQASDTHTGNLIWI